MSHTKDPVDLIREQWHRERPELPTDAMATLGRLKRCSALYQPVIDNVFKEFGLSSWEFDVLATLRRSGTPHQLSPTELFRTLLVTSGTMTHRLKNLEKKSLIERIASLDDARNKSVKLTAYGLELVEQALVKHVDNMEALLSPLTETEKAELNRSLKKLLFILEN
ncbi:MarR family winged helix-turn-helix transcriptional regulator [Reinekea sp.]|jgi:DNA-binding MarR family transcriptional regulator|uniref:MarR family winged helix-turn-helix transcriptional regulator n=1 Tax=Reinekea sp. TaxID=1970455 RepID=UPI003989DFDD